MSMDSQLYWPVGMELPEGTERLNREYWPRTRSIFTKYLSSTRRLGEEVEALYARWDETVNKLGDIYLKGAPLSDSQALAYWLSSVYYECALSVEEVEELGLEPFMAVYYVSGIMEDGTFPDAEEFWTTPDKLERACRGLVEALEARNKTALKAQALYIGDAPDDEVFADPEDTEDPEDEEGQASGDRADAGRKGYFRKTLQELADNAAKLEKKGIEKVGFLLYM